MGAATQLEYKKRLVVEAAEDMLEGAAVNGHKLNDFKQALTNYGAAAHNYGVGEAIGKAEDAYVLEGDD